MCKSVAAIMLYYLADCVLLQIEINIRKKSGKGRERNYV
jgi:hypothetical protein